MKKGDRETREKRKEKREEESLLLLLSFAIDNTLDQVVIVGRSFGGMF